MLDVIRKRPHGDLLFEEPDAAEAPRCVPPLDDFFMPGKYVK